VNPERPKKDLEPAKQIYEPESMKTLLAKVSLSLFFVTTSILLNAQKSNPAFDHVEPAFWWTGMKNPSVQVLFHSDHTNIGAYKPEITYEGVTIKDVKTVSNPHYLFVTLDIASTAKPGMIAIRFSGGKKALLYNYELKVRSLEKNRVQGFNSSDVVYLIMPDRFANGDVKNDTLPGMYEGAHRERDGARHGGDIKGIADHLDYIKDLGVTAIWLNPVLENNQRKSSYHGYAITNLYAVDRRFGGNDAYLSFINKSHQLGLKVIQDMVMNHIGNEHWLMHDLPERDWVHQWPEFTRSNYQGIVLSDPYKSSSDLEKMNNGWFDTTMPDVNQENSLFARYLIQNTLWWIEYAGLDGIRMDTQPYPNKEFMSQWAKEVLTEYPTFNIVGEVWINSIPVTAYWQKGMNNADGYQSNLPCVTDFPFYFTVPQALNEPAGWESGMRRLYNLLSQDFIYPNANGNLTFLDNHDLTRFFLTVGRDLKKFKIGLAFLLTTRGIPQLYYGTELLMDGDGGHHPNVRKDFPGGWKEDEVNAFTREGRTPVQNDAFDYLQTLLQWRKKESLIHTGKLTHYIPEDNVYVYFRHNEKRAVMVILNGDEGDKQLDLKRFSENLKGYTRIKNVITGQSATLGSSLRILGQTALIVELQ
jgi:neopullulanase